MPEYAIYNQMKYSTPKPEVISAALASDEYCLQLKEDGASYIWAKDLDGSVHLYGDKISKKTGLIVDKIENVPHMKTFAEQYFPNGTQFLVEILYYYDWKNDPSLSRRPFSKSTYVSGILGSTLPSKAIERQSKTENAEPYIFDCLFWDNKSLIEEDFGDRWNFIYDTIFKAEPKMKDLHFAETIYDNKLEAITRWLAIGQEGGVLKLLKSNKRYSAAYGLRLIGETAYRPAGTAMKIKQTDSVDLIVLDIQMPTKEYTGKDADNYAYRDENNEPVNRLYSLGLANAFVVGAYDANGKLVEIGTVSSGMDDFVRRDVIENRDDWIGSVIEVACMSVDRKAHTLRHPIYKCRRDDKVAKEIRIGDQI